MTMMINMVIMTSNVSMIGVINKMSRVSVIWISTMRRINKTL